MTSEKTSMGCLRGNARHWFWPVGSVLLWMLIWTTASPSVYSALLGRMGLRQNANVIYIAAGIQTLLHTAAWVMIGLAYGLTNRVKAFKIMFFTVAGVQLLGSYGHFLSNFAVVQALYSRGPMNPAMSAYTLAMSVLLNGAWIAFTLIVICHKRTGGVLKGASIVLLVARIIPFAYNYGVGTFYPRLVENMNVRTATAIVGLTGFGMNVLTYGSLIFFFGAMAFSRMREAERIAAQ